MAGCRSATKLALSAVEELKIGKCGETVEECQELLEKHEAQVTAVFSDSRLSALQLEGEQLVANMKQTDVSDKTPDWKDTMEIVAKLYIKMNQVFSKLDVLCRKRKRELEDCLQLKYFHEEHAKVRLSGFFRAVSEALPNNVCIEEISRGVPKGEDTPTFANLVRNERVYVGEKQDYFVSTEFSDVC